MAECRICGSEKTDPNQIVDWLIDVFDTHRPVVLHKGVTMERKVEKAGKQVKVTLWLVDEADSR